MKALKATFDQLRDGVETPNGLQIQWVGNKRLGRIEIQEQVWTVNWDFTTENYEEVLTGKEFEFTDSDGNVTVIPGENMTGAFLNSLAVAIPATLIPILIAAFAAYGFAWMNFPGRRLLFIMIIALLVVPLQIALVPILRDYSALGINGTFLAIWLAHTGFGLPLATYLLYNYIRTLPREILESAFIDGASHFTIFQRLILPLSVPALASFAIFQFLWVWNDYLVALIFIGANPDLEVVTMALAEITGSRGNDWHLLNRRRICEYDPAHDCVLRLYKDTLYVDSWPDRLKGKRVKATGNLKKERRYSDCMLMPAFKPCRCYPMDSAWFSVAYSNLLQP